MGGIELETKALGGELPGGVAVHRQGIGDRGAEQGIAECGEDQPERRLADVMLLVTDAELGDERPDRFEDRVQRVPIAGQDHPGGERPGSFSIEGIEGAVDDFAGFRLAGTGAGDGLGDASGDPLGDRAGKLRLESGGGPEMVKEVGVRSSDLGGNRLQGHGLRALFEQQLPSGLQCGGPAFPGVEAFAAY